MTNPIRITLLALLAGLSLLSTGCSASGGDYRVYIGTFTNAKSKGIYLMSMDSKTGKLSEPHPRRRRPAPAPPSSPFTPITTSSMPSMRSTTSKARKPARSAPSRLRSDGKLKLINQQPSGGTGPTQLTIDPTGKTVLDANYAGGSAAALPVNEDGSLGPPSSIDQHGWGKTPLPTKIAKDSPHAHSIYPDPDNRFVLSCDLGLDKVIIYKFDPAASTIQYHDAGVVDPASGPRHLAFAPARKAVYVLNEMACTVTAFHYDAEKGALQSFQTITTLPDDFHGNKSTAEIFVHPNGKFVYASNRGDANSITVFKIDDETGKLTFVDRTSTQGKTPRGFGIDPNGNWLIAGNQDSSTVAVFKIDPTTGKLTPTGQVVNVPTPVCVTFVH